MELSSIHSLRHHQFTDIHKQLLNQYAQLQSKHEVLKLEVIEYKTKANYWETQFKNLKSREELLKSELEEMKAQLRKREQQLFGKGSEKVLNTMLVKLRLQKINEDNKPVSLGLVDEIIAICLWLKKRFLYQNKMHNAPVVICLIKYYLVQKTQKF